MIVLDASAALELLLRTEAGQRVEARVFDRPSTLHAPHLLDVEVIQVLRRYQLQREISGDRGRQALADLADLPLRRYPHDLFLERIWELRHNVTAYDAAYLALAEALDVPLLTRDEGLATVPGCAARVELI